MATELTVKKKNTIALTSGKKYQLLRRQWQSWHQQLKKKSSRQLVLRLVCVYTCVWGKRREREERERERRREREREERERERELERVLVCACVCVCMCVFGSVCVWVCVCAGVFV